MSSWQRSISQRTFGLLTTFSWNYRARPRPIASHGVMPSPWLPHRVPASLPARQVQRARALLGWFEQRQDYFTGFLAGLILLFVAHVLWSMQFGLAPASLPPRQDGAAAPAQAAPAGAAVAPAALVQVEQIYMGRSEGVAVTAFNADEPAATPPAPQPVAKSADTAKVSDQKPRIQKSKPHNFGMQTLSANHRHRNVRRGRLVAGR
jgi:hypothetical protein